jgi:hypothetical protein
MSQVEIKEEQIEDPTLYGEINVRNANTQVWLIKVPDYLATHWRSLRDGDEIGKITLEANDSLGNNLQVPLIKSSQHEKEYLDF